MREKVAAITGSRRGIGRAIAEELAKDGYSVVLSGVTGEEDSQELVGWFTGRGYDAKYIRCDVSEGDDRRAFFDFIVSAYGRLDVYVNNAGVAPTVRADVLETTQESFDRVLAVNLTGAFFMCQSAANMMVSMRGQLPAYTPRIINITSVSSFTASANRGEYCISKAGASMITKLFADRLAGYNIPVFEIQPGIILTDMTASSAERYAALIEGGLTPTNRIGLPRDVADCVMAAVSGKLDFATGQILNPDGGFHIRRL